MECYTYLRTPKKRKRRQECCGYCEKCITIGLCITRFRYTRFSRKKVSVKPDAESLGTNSKEFDSQSRRYVKQVSGKRKDHRSGKIQVELPHQRGPYAVKFEDQSHEETERQQRCVRSKAWNLAKNIFKLKENTRLHSTFPRRNGYSRLRQQKSWKKESLWWIPELVCMWSARETLNLLSWRPSRSPTTVMTANGEVQTREEATVRQRIGLIHDGYAS